ncbi:MAG TPA: hypothetical protein VF407_07850 [Polyangiaceae bacterium]
MNRVSFSIVLVASFAALSACSRASGGASVSVETQTPSGSSSHGLSIGNGGVPAAASSVCGPYRVCTQDCPDGKCDQTCVTGASCTFSCAGGACNQTCDKSSNCNASCAGGKCKQVCGDASCHVTCSGGDCTTK